MWRRTKAEAHSASSNWDVLRNYLVSTLMLDTEWMWDGNESFLWWGSPVPVQIRVINKYESEDGLVRDIVEVAALVGKLQPGYDRSVALRTIHEWHVEKPVGAVYIDAEDDVVMFMRFTYNQSASSGRSVAAYGLLHLSAWSTELADRLQKSCPFTVNTTQHPSSGPRTDFDELTGQLLNGSSLPFPLPKLNDIATLEAFALSLGEYDMRDVRLLPEVDSNPAYVSFASPRVPDVRTAAFIKAANSKNGPGLRVVAYTGKRFNQDARDALLEIVNLLLKVMNEDESRLPAQLTAGLALERFGEYDEITLEFFIPAMALIGLVADTEDAGLLGNSLAFVASMVTAQAIRVRAMLEELADMEIDSPVE